jgi:hypothetical protein
MIIVTPQVVDLISSSTPADEMFDEYVNTQVEDDDYIEVEIGFSNCDRVALFNLEATDIDLELSSSGLVVQTKNIDLAITGTDEYREYIVEPMYIYPNAVLKITINNLGSTARCGVCAIGLSRTLGQTRPGVQTGFIDYSIKDTNEFGQTFLNPGAWAKSPDITVQLPYDNIDAVFEDLVDARGSLLVIEANEPQTDFEALRVLGFISDWRLKITNPTIAHVQLSIQGVA